MGQGIASGITAVADAYSKYKQDQAQYDATKKMYKAFEGYLPKEQREAVRGIFDDTTISIAEKNKLAPMLFNLIGAAQTQRFALERGAQQESGATGRTKIGAQVEAYKYGGAPAPQLGADQTQGDIVQPTQQDQLPQYGAEGMPGTDMQGGTPLAPVISGAPFYDQGFVPIKRKKPIAERYQSHIGIKY